MIKTLMMKITMKVIKIYVLSCQHSALAHKGACLYVCLSVSLFLSICSLALFVCLHIPSVCLSLSLPPNRCLFQDLKPISQHHKKKGDVDI